MYTWRELVALYRLTDPSPPSNLQPRYNICPTTTIDAVIQHDSKRVLEQMRWGLVPSWWKKPLKELRLQLSCDSGTGDRVGCFESRVAGIGPQIGFIISISKEYQGYFNLKGYWEFDAANRADGWNTWLTFAISPAAPGEAPPASRRMITK